MKFWWNPRSDALLSNEGVHEPPKSSWPMPDWLVSTPSHELSGHRVSPRMIATCTSLESEFCGGTG